MSLLRGFLHRFHEAQDRDKRFISQLDINILNGVLLPLYVGFICLDFLDVYSTLLAMKVGPIFQELNPIAASLFQLQFQGFLLAIVFKYLPAMPLFFAVFAMDRSDSHAFEIRLVKFTALVALLSADLFLGYVVVANNIPPLIKPFFDHIFHSL